jgi:hypothetical protein
MEKCEAYVQMLFQHGAWGSIRHHQLAATTIAGVGCFCVAFEKKAPLARSPSRFFGLKLTAIVIQVLASHAPYPLKRDF